MDNPVTSRNPTWDPHRASTTCLILFCSYLYVPMYVHCLSVRSRQPPFLNSQQSRHVEHFPHDVEHDFSHSFFSSFSFDDFSHAVEPTASEEVAFEALSSSSTSRSSFFFVSFRSVPKHITHCIVPALFCHEQFAHSQAQSADSFLSGSNSKSSDSSAGVFSSYSDKSCSTELEGADPRLLRSPLEDDMFFISTSIRLCADRFACLLSNEL